MINEAKEKGLDFAKWIGEAREKTSIQPVSFLTPEAIESVDEYLQLLEKKHGKLPTYIWCNSKPNRFISNEGLNKRLRRIVSKANIKIGNQTLRRRTIMEAFIYGKLAHANTEKEKIFNQWANNPILFPMLEFEFNNILEFLLRVIHTTSQLNAKAIEELKSTKNPS